MEKKNKMINNWRTVEFKAEIENAKEKYLERERERERVPGPTICLVCLGKFLNRIKRALTTKFSRLLSVC